MRLAALTLLCAGAIVFVLPAAHAGRGPSSILSAKPGPPSGCSHLDQCPWKKKPWYDAVNSDFWFVSSSPPGECAFGGSRYVINEAGDPDFAPWGCGRPVFVWAKSCSAGPQTVDFKKTVFLPGVPLNLEASLRPYQTPLKSMEILVNGQVVLSATHSVHKIDLKSKAHAFKFGNNVIEISAKKGSSKQPCNADKPDTGVLMELHAHFAADVVTTIDPPTQGNTALFQQYLTVKNNGPSATAYTGLAFIVGTSKLKVYPFNPNAAVILTAGAALGGPPLPICSYYAGSGYSTYCTVGGLQAGESVKFGVRYIYDAPPTGNFYDEFIESWSAVGDTNDPNYGNGGSRKRVVCRQSVPPPCVKP